MGIAKRFGAVPAHEGLDAVLGRFRELRAGNMSAHEAQPGGRIVTGHGFHRDRREDVKLSRFGRDSDFGLCFHVTSLVENVEEIASASAAKSGWLMLVTMHPFAQEFDPCVRVGRQRFGVVVNDVLRAVGENLDEA